MAGKRISFEARTPDLHESWLTLIGDQFERPYMQDLRAFLLAEKRAGKAVYPPGEQIFAALNLTPVESVRVIIIGQDPYHGPGQAHGLSFSVPDGVPIPPSLRNIFQEINTDMALAESALTSAPASSVQPAAANDRRRSGNLSYWASQGVLLLNAVLTVVHSQAGAHQGKGWETFTDVIVRRLSEQRSGLVFMLWGSYAHKKGAVVDASRHQVFRAPHPSPLSAHRGFFGCRHFSQANAYLQSQGHAPIDWVSDGLI